MGDVTFYYLIKHNINKRTLVRYCIHIYLILILDNFRLVCQVLFVKIGFGAVYFTTSVFALIWLNLGNHNRQPGQLSAYSVFNPGFESIEGTLTGDQFDAEIRHKKPI